MAGGNLFSSKSKKPTNEVLFENQNERPKTAVKKEYRSPESIKQQFLVEYQHKDKVLFDHRQIETQQRIEEIRQELKKLVHETQELDNQIINAAESNVFEYNIYQLSFLDRIKSIIINIRLNISEASNWFESFVGKKKKRNCFWNKTKSKHGGSQYLQSGEHSAARSAN